jgi:hypothetical protein
LGQFSCDRHFRGGIADLRCAKLSNRHGLTFKMSAPHAILIVVIYILGMVTGGGLATLMRQAFEGSRSS